jgi:hypothetical protein
MTSAWSLPLLVAAILLAIACGAHKADATYGVDVSSVHCPPPLLSSASLSSLSRSPSLRADSDLMRRVRFVSNSL